jgi:hypothetical protein
MRTFSNKKILLRLGLLLLGAAFLCSAASSRGDLPLILLESGKPETTTGGMSGSWGTLGGWAKMGVHGEEDKSRSLRFEYNVSDARQNAGWWFAFRHLDMRSYQSVRFKVRGRNGGEMIAIGFKDDRWYEERISIQNYLAGGVAKEWKEVTIPLKDFARVRQWDSMDNFSISFFYGKDYLPRSEVYVKDIELVATGATTSPPWHATGEERQIFPISIDTQKASEDQVLDLVQRSAFGYFWNEANPKNGLIKDRCYAFGPDQRKIASIAAVGFGLSAICVADRRGWIAKDAAYERVYTTLKFFERSAQKYNGFYFHYYEMDTGAPVRGSEISSVDTGIFLAGVLTVKQHYKGTEVEVLAKNMLDQVNWGWMMNKENYLSMAWFPGNKFLPHLWRDYNEAIMLYFLGVASTTHPIPPEVWQQIDREKFKYKEIEFVAAAGENSLFEHQYPQVWFDLRGLIDKNGVDYFDNSAVATRLNRQWCLDNAGKFKTFAAGFWGLTACDGPGEYVVNGAPHGYCEGTVAPTAPIGSIPFAPELAVEQIRKYFTLEDHIWGKYGFVDAFNLDKNWFSSVYIGIDQGPIVLMIENYRTGAIWDLVGSDPQIQNAYKLMGFRAQEVPTAPVMTQDADKPRRKNKT